MKRGRVWWALILLAVQVCKAVWRPHVGHGLQALNSASEANMSFLSAGVSSPCNSILRGNPENIKCPGACPYLRLEPQHICEFQCVQPQDCGTKDPFVNFPDSSTYRCASCEVPACKLCSSKNTCEVCHEHGFKLVDGKCEEVSHWWLTWCVFGGILLPVLAAIIWGLCQPKAKRGEENLKHGLAHRHQGRYHDHDQSVTPRSQSTLYDLRTNLCTNPIAGPGGLVHFRWMVILMMWTACVCIIFLLLEAVFPPRLDAFHPKDLRTPDPRLLQACEKDRKDEMRALWFRELIYSLAVLIIYISSSICSVFLARHLVDTFYHPENIVADFENPFINAFTLMVTGLPRKADDYQTLDTSGSRQTSPGASQSRSLEEQVKMHLECTFKQLCPFLRANILGVSICWDYRNVRNQVNTEAERMVDEMDAEVAQLAQSQVSDVEAPSDVLVGRMSSGVLQRVSEVFQPVAKAMSADEIREMLEGIEPSGSAYVTFETPKDCRQFLTMYQRARYAGDLKDRTLQLESVSLGPKHVLWEEFGTSWLWFCIKFGFSIIVIFISIPLLEIFFYGPNVHFLLYYHDVPLMNEGSFWNGILLGGLCGAINLVIAKLIEKMMAFSGFTSRASSEYAFMILFFLAVFLNTIVDLTTFAISSLGYTGVKLQDFHAVEDRISMVLSFADKPGVQTQFFNLILSSLPATLIAPSLAEPLGTVLLPYLLSTGYIKRHRRGTKAEAEALLEYPAFDERRYGDILVNVVLCVSLLIWTQHKLVIVFVVLLASQVVTYLWDHYRLLRYSSRTTLASFKLTEWACLSLCTPCAVMAAVLVARLQKLRGLDLQPPELAAGQLFTQPLLWVQIYCDSLLFLGPAAFVMHFSLHYLVMKLGIKKFIQATEESSDEELGIEAKLSQSAIRMIKTSSDQKSPYEKERTKSPYKSFDSLAPISPINYFNTNPVHCLRSKYILEEDPPVCFHKYGKEYLLAKTWEMKLNAFEKRLTPR
mmetsp:Transcript_98625/g.172193  ORF Transcript_98625/g.172193 Transcript_98625/m.172193 type:complete len:989 (-) Transcript_98625:81-3047(-)